MSVDETPEPVELRIEEREGVVVVVLAGELDLACADRVAAAIDRATAQSVDGVVVDLRELAYMDSTGLRTLLDAHGRAAARGRRFAVVPGSGPAQRIIALTGAGALLETVEGPDELRPGDAREPGGG